LKHDGVGLAQQAELLRLERAADTVAIATVWKYFWMNGITSPPRVRACARARAISLQPPPAGQQADAGLDQPDVALERRHGLARVHLELAAAAERHAADAATTGTSENLMRMRSAGSRSTIASKLADRPPSALHRA
jgi:hypothetical protein